jgi:hypothetical protein
VTASLAWRWEWPNAGLQLLVSAEAALVWHVARQRWWERERGGQLFVDLSRPDGMWLSLATPPHSDDRRGRHWLILDPARCRREIEDANRRGLRLIGYWHTHPQRIPQLSKQDHHSFEHFTQTYREQLPHPLAVLVGQAEELGGIRAWSVRADACIEAVHAPADDTCRNGAAAG